MSKRLLFILLILLCFILSIALTYSLIVVFTPVRPEAKSGFPVHNLNTRLNYTNIQAAIYAPETLDGQTILIDAQTYYEHVVVNKSLTLIGESEDNTIVDGNGTGNIIHIIASDVTIKNLTVTNGTTGIILDSSNNGTITRNNVRNNDYEGIYLKGCSNNTISHNNVAGSSDGILVNSSSNNAISYNNVTGNSNYGILVNSSSNNAISYNNVTSNYEGVYIDYSNNSCVTKIIAIKNNDAITVRYSYNSTIQQNIVGNNTGDAIVVRYSYNSTIQQNIVGNNTGRGIFVTNSQGFNVNNNDVYSNQYYGINANSSVDGLIKQNEANKNSFDGIGMLDSGDCVVTENNVSNGKLWGMYADDSYNLSIYNNNFINNPLQATSTVFRNAWDNGYPSGGNYWSDYTGIDEKSGPYQNQTGSDGIGDTPYEIDANNTDNYPLMGMFWSFNTTYNYGVNIVSNSSISDFNFTLSGARQATLTFNVSGATGTPGFCRICIPKALINASYIVKLDGEILAYRELPGSNETYEYLYINYTQSEHKIQITGTTPIA